MIPLAGFAQKPPKKDSLVIISTPYGDMTVVLYLTTPKHRANFLKLADEGFFDSTLFHRVIKDFMIQGGDPYSKDPAKRAQSGQGGPGYTLPAEIVPGLFHRKGVLAAARQGDAVNPKRRSSGSQFYIVQGKKMSGAELNIAESRIQRVLPTYTLTEDMRNAYQELGGSPWLDQQYTIFGEVIDGLGVIDTVAAQPTGRADMPQTDIPISMRVEVIKRKKVTKQFGYEYPSLPSKDEEEDEKEEKEADAPEESPDEDQ